MIVRSRVSRRRGYRFIGTAGAVFAFLAIWLPGAQAAILCTVIADAATGKPLLEQGACTTRVTPASTFKVPLSLMGFDSGLLENATTPALTRKNGARVDPASWMKDSILWYSQAMTGKLGETRFRDYVQAFEYGNKDVTGDPGKHNGLTEAWLSSSLKISPLEQLAFLRKLVHREFPVSPHAYEMTDQITALGKVAGWTVHGKTGTGAPRKNAGAAAKPGRYGWFVGWLKKGDRTLVFARLVQDETMATPRTGPRTRAAFLEELPALVGKL